MRQNLLTAVVTLIYLSFSLVLSGCSSRAESREPVKIPVQVITPRQSEADCELSFSGMVTPQVITAPAFQVGGKIISLPVKVGETVRRGQVIAKLDPSVYQDQMQTSRANVHLARANLAKVQAGARSQEVEMARQQMLQARHSFELAQSEKNRFTNLYKMDAIPKRQYESVITQYNLAQDQLKAGEQRYQLVKEGASKEDKQIAGASLELALSNQAAAGTQLSYTRLLSPIDGVITEKKAEVGGVVGAGVPIYEIRSTDELDLVILIPSRHLDRIRLGEKARIRFLDTPEKTCSGAVREIKPASEMPTGSYRVRVKLLDPALNKIYSGQLGKADFSSGKSLAALSVPLSCLQKTQAQKNYYIYTVSAEDTARRIPVKVLRLEDEQALISGDFNAGTKIIVSGQDYLKDGSPVKIVEALGSEKAVSPDMETAAGDPGVKI